MQPWPRGQGFCVTLDDPLGLRRALFPLDHSSECVHSADHFASVISNRQALFGETLLNGSSSTAVAPSSR